MALPNPFKTPSAVVLAKRELEETKRLLLDMQAKAEHAAKMVEYYQGVVSRLDNYILAESPLPVVTHPNIEMPSAFH